MKKSTLFFIIISSILLLMATTCEDDIILTCEDRLDSLNELELKIENLVNESECGGNFECRYIAFGSKPCGGPWSYLIYSTSIDTLKLERLVDRYNANGDIYNFECNVVSDCSIPNPPIDFECENNKCIPIF